MPSFFRSLLNSDAFMPHGHCYLWRPDILWLNVGSDLFIALAYYAIPLALIYFVRRRKDLAFNWIFVMFALFIVACGTTHLIEILTVWRPYYGLQGMIKFFTAAISLATAIVLWPLMPKAIQLPSFTELAKKNKELEALNEQIQLSSESRLHQIIEAAPNGILMVDQNGKIVLCNAQIESLFGYQRKELIGQTIETLVPERFRQKHPHYRDAYLANPETRQMGAGRDLTGLRKDGTEIPIEIGLNPLQTNEGPFILASIVDITERKAIEQKLREAITARDEFMSIASHELKTPLTSLSLQIQMARRKIDPSTGAAPTPEQLAKVFDQSGRFVKRLIGLIDDLMDSSRIRTGKFSFKFEEVNLSELTQDMLGRLSAGLAKAGITPKLDIEDHIIGRLDSLRMEQVIDNLLTNAMKYASKCPIEVSLKKHGNMAELKIQDYGPGIPAEKQSKVFDRFERATKSTEIGGLGLGLFIVKEIIQAHLGTIRLESEEGKGTKFTVTLPLDHDQNNESMPNQNLVKDPIGVH